VSAFPYNVRYALPAIFGFLAVMVWCGARQIAPILSRLLLGGVLVVGLWADAQWFYSPAYRKGDSRAVAEWLLENQDRIRSWTVLPDYLAISIQWYLEPHAEILARFQPPQEPQTTSFPPVPDVLIIGRRHHILRPDQLIASYCAEAGKVQAIHSFAGFELYARSPGRT